MRKRASHEKNIITNSGKSLKNRLPVPYILLKKATIFTSRIVTNIKKKIRWLRSTFKKNYAANGKMRKNGNKKGWDNVRFAGPETSSNRTRTLQINSTVFLLPLPMTR